MKYINFFGAFFALSFALFLGALVENTSVTIFAIGAIGVVWIVIAICLLAKEYRRRRRLYKKYKGWRCGRLADDFWSASLDDKLWVYDQCFDSKVRKLIAKHCAAEMQKALEAYPAAEMSSAPNRDKELAELAEKLHFAADSIYYRPSFFEKMFC